MIKLSSFALFLLLISNIAIAKDIAEYVPEIKSNLPACNDKKLRNECFDKEEYPDGIKYYGEFKNNKREGYGIAIFSNNGVFEGIFKDGWRLNGKQTLKNGDVYIGDFFEGSYHGRGEAIFTDGRIYKGDFKLGKFSGKGTMSYPNGDVYTGDFQDDALNGNGIYRFKNGEIYEGEYRLGKASGKGMTKFVNGDVYIGDYQDGVFDGNGIYRFKNGEVYEGEYKLGKASGKGTRKPPDGAIYIGDYQDGKFEGRGILQYLNGDVYEGGFSKGSFSQNGVYKYKSGEKFIGNFENGAASGFGEYHFIDGRTYVGDFKLGRFAGWGIEFLDKEIISRQGVWDDGELINAAVVDPDRFPHSYGLKSKGEIESLNANVYEAFRSLRKNQSFVNVEKTIFAINNPTSSKSSVELLDAKSAINQLIQIRESLADDALKEEKIIIIEDKINDLNRRSIEELRSLGINFTKNYPSGHYFNALGVYYNFLYTSWSDPAKIAKYSKPFLNENNIQAVARVEYGDEAFEIGQCKYRIRAYSWYFMGNGLEKDVNLLQQIANRVNYALNVLSPCIDINQNEKKTLLGWAERYLAYTNNLDKRLEVNKTIGDIGTQTLSDRLALKLSRGHILRSAFKNSDAEIEFSEALKIAQENGLSEWIFDAEDALAILYIDLKDFNKAESLLIKNISLSNINGAANWSKCQRLSLLARSYEQQAMFENAIAIRKVCINLVDIERKQMVSASELGDKAFYANAWYAGFYEALATILIDTGRLPEAQQVLDMLKEEEQFEFIRRSNDADPRKARVGQTAKEQEWLERYKKISDRLGSLGAAVRALDELSKLGLSQSQQQRQKRLKADLVVAQSAFGSFIGEMRKGFAAKGVAKSIEMSETSEQAAKEMQSLIRSLGDGVALLQYYITDEKVGILLTTPGVQIARSFKIGRKELNRQISEFRIALRDPKSDPLPAAKALYKVLLEPVENDLNQVGAKTIMLSLDGTLRYLPFGALNNGKQYIAQRWNLPIYTSVVRERLRNPASAKWRAAGFGVTRAFGEFVALPAVRAEISSIVKTAENSGVVPGEIFLDEEFSARRLKDMGQQKVELLHVASHFQFSPGTEANSFLLLGDGQQLTLGDLRMKNYRFDNVDLLTLSACDTGLGGGRDEKGKEIEGFGVIAQQQGANAVLATLWPVADQSTATLMADMYSRRQTHGLSKIEALRQAQMALMQQPKYAHPFYWAPFILLGNWK